MTHYIDYIRALKAGVTINDYNHTYKLMRLSSLPHVEASLVIPDKGIAFTAYRYEAPVVTVTVEAPLAVESKPSMQENIIYNDLPTTPTLLASVRLADKIRYVDGKRIVSEQWSGKAYPVTGVQHGFMILDTGYGAIGRKPENVRYVAQVTGVQIAEAA